MTAYNGIWILPPLINSLKQQQQKKNVKIGPPLTKLSGSAHETVWTKIRPDKTSGHDLGQNFKTTPVVVLKINKQKKNMKNLHACKESKAQIKSFFYS